MHMRRIYIDCTAKRQKAFPYSILSVGPGADTSVQAVSPHVTVSYPPGGRLPLLSARPAVTSPATQHHRPLAGTKLYCLVTEAHRCEQLAQGCYAALPRVGFDPATYWSQMQRSTRCNTAPPCTVKYVKAQNISCFQTACSFTHQLCSPSSAARRFKGSLHEVNCPAAETVDWLIE